MGTLVPVVLIVIVAALCFAYLGYYIRFRKVKPPTPEEAAQRELEERELIYGPTNPVLVCPHCRKKGQVRTRGVERKKGISGGKATGAVLTGGLSALATGLSRKEWETQAHCDNCNSTWHF
ncbi:MAG: hypothetical protein LLG45_01500 [Actinomycetia bacterium]|nr:hypothetical protein [Actinomycetes bacterium]